MNSSQLSVRIVGVVADTVDGVEVELIPYRADRLVLIAPADHPIARRASASFAEVLDHPCVMLHAGSAIHTFTMNAAALVASLTGDAAGPALGA